MINIVKNILYACISITSLGLLLCAERRPSMPPPYIEGPPPAYASPVVGPIAPAAVVPIVPPLNIAPNPPPVINNVINVIENVSQLNMDIFSINRHYSQRYWLSFTVYKLQPLTKLTIYYCDMGYLYSWDINFPKKKKKYKRIKVYQIGGYYLLKSRFPSDLLDISIYSICLL